MRKILLLSCALLLIACGSTSKRAEQFDVVAQAYERAIRWSDFRTALGLGGVTNTPALEFSRLEWIRVTSYDVMGVPVANANTSQILQLVEIRYVNTLNMAEKMLTDRQVWEYLEKEQRWKLVSPFPAFR